LVLNRVDRLVTLSTIGYPDNYKIESDPHNLEFLAVKNWLSGNAKVAM
jgi:hypothetical protein